MPRRSHGFRADLAWVFQLLPAISATLSTGRSKVTKGSFYNDIRCAKRVVSRSSPALNRRSDVIDRS